MLISIGVHWCVELVGGATFSCITWGCRNAAHRHSRVARLFTEHKYARWALTAALTMLTSTITVLIVG